MSLKILRNILLGLAALVIAYGAGFTVGAKNKSNISFVTQISGKTSEKPISVDFSLFWDVWDLLGQAYIDKNALDPAKMVNGAISGMVAALDDPYTVFLPPEQNKASKDELGGKFEGIGAQLGIKDKKIVVVAPLPQSPAEKAGLKAGDWIVKVDNQDSAGWTLPEAVFKIRGPKGSTVNLTVLQKEASKTAQLAVIRDEIKVASVEWDLKKSKCKNQSFDNAQDKNEKCEIEIIAEECGDCKKVAYLKLARFGDQTTDEWNQAVDEITKELDENKNQIKGLVLDVRNNPGGYLSGSAFIASEFLGSGTVVIQEQANGQKQSFDVDRKGRLLKIPMVILINKGSASAAEIVAGALKTHGRAKLVGETTFGKGSIQEAKDLKEGAGIHITTAKWLLPDGKWINEKGITPDIEVVNDENNPDDDLQLIKAIETLVN